jgi:hypothetical protein
MRVGQDIAVRFPGLYLVHHNIPGKKVSIASAACIVAEPAISRAFQALTLFAGPGDCPPRSVL